MLHIYLSFYILKEVKVGYFSTTNQLFSHNSKQAPPLLCKPILNIAFVYDDELLLFKYAYLRRCLG
jgi:hypothetical protein